MAQKKDKAKTKEAPKAKGKETAKPVADDKAAKRAARMEALKNRPAEQRPNSKQVDVIAAGTGKVLTFGYPIRKTGTLVTTVLLDAKGNPIGLGSAYIPNTRVKVKKNHGAIQPGVGGKSKKEDDDDEDESDED